MQRFNSKNCKKKGIHKNKRTKYMYVLPIIRLVFSCKNLLIVSNVNTDRFTVNRNLGTNILHLKIFYPKTKPKSM